jgi:hypothetical protein
MDRSAASDRLPWYVWTSLASVSCILAGSYWDISWHMSIGRDSFWTPAHLLIQAGGILGGAAGAGIVFATTFRRDAPLRAASIGVWGFRGPLGAYLAAWGAATMVVSAPFDNWWHSAYGLDVKILSPPHAVLTLGIVGVTAGGVMLVISAMNRATGRARARAGAVLLVLGGELLTLSMLAILEQTFRFALHHSACYRAAGIAVPMFLLAVAEASERPWAATLVAGFYTVFAASMVWLFPLVPAEPKLGPVYQPITHLVPLGFPILIIAPAIALDVLRARWRGRSRWWVAPVMGAIFVGVLLAVEWPFASFLQTEAARNVVFGSHYLPYFAAPDWYLATYTFMPDPSITTGLTEAVIAASISCALGLWLGDALRKVRR